MYKFMEDRHKERVPGHQQEAGAHVWECEQSISPEQESMLTQVLSRDSTDSLSMETPRRQTNMSTGPR